MAGPEDSDRTGAKQSAMRVDTKLVRELAKLLSENDLTEIEVEDGDRKIKVCRQGAPMMVSSQPGYAMAPPANPAAPATAAAAPAAPAEAAGEAVKSPMVGTAFLSAEPGAKPFVSIGDKVKPGDTLLIVEAMKVMNPILAPKAGTVSKIMVSDAQPVEFDQALVMLD